MLQVLAGRLLAVIEFATGCHRSIYHRQNLILIGL